MSNPFSYELDERQIRIMLRDGEAESDPTAWSRFEQLAQHESKSKSASIGPKWNLSISRSVIVPVAFVVLIGGLSATLFSFVDFKKKEVKVANHTLEAKSQVDAAPASRQKSTPSLSTAVPTPTVADENNITATPSPSPEPAIQVAQSESKPVIRKSEPEPSTTTTTAAKTSSPPVVSASAATPTLAGKDTGKSDQPVTRKRRQKKVVSEEIPTINTSSIQLNQGSQEPELDLR